MLTHEQPLFAESHYRFKRLSKWKVLLFCKLRLTGHGYSFCLFVLLLFVLFCFVFATRGAKLKQLKMIYASEYQYVNGNRTIVRFLSHSRRVLHAVLFNFQLLFKLLSIYNVKFLRGIPYLSLSFIFAVVC